MWLLITNTPALPFVIVDIVLLVHDCIISHSKFKKTQKFFDRKMTNATRISYDDSMERAGRRTIITKRVPQHNNNNDNRSPFSLLKQQNIHAHSAKEEAEDDLQPR
jgi:hypothetical protein